MNDKPVDAMSFEEALQALEQVVGQLETGQVALENSITLYERGAKLKTHCETKLKTAEEKIAKITLDADGDPVGIQVVTLD